jgi:hypothetical protein
MRQLIQPTGSASAGKGSEYELGRYPYLYNHRGYFMVATIAGAWELISEAEGRISVHAVMAAFPLELRVEQLI